ncbi:acyl-CoA dehydrogenase [Alteromonadaceae bacterium M269]|nr:acyl-CoA dehydrogenase [Alteromonadaceae bacterium M269]
MNDTDQMTQYQAEFRAFAQDQVEPYAAEHDRSQKIADHIVPQLAQRGYLAPFLDKKWMGKCLDMVTISLLHEEIGAACSSVRSLLTVHGMAASAINRWGKSALQDKVLPALVHGDLIGAFALSEPNAGSDLEGIETTATLHKDGYVLNGKKKWITFGQLADLYLLLAKSEKGPIAFIVERQLAGLDVVPIDGMTGTRGSMVAQLNFNDVLVPHENVLASPAFGNAVMLNALNFGRLSVASGSVGIIQACLNASLVYADKVQRFGEPLRNHQLIAQMISNMTTDLAASRLLCRAAAESIDKDTPDHVQSTFLAKYFSSTAAMRAATNTVQIHGANGCNESFPAERLMRDAKVMEIIEGTTQILQVNIAELEYQSHRQRSKNLTR